MTYTICPVRYCPEQIGSFSLEMTVEELMDLKAEYERHLLNEHTPIEIVQALSKNFISSLVENDKIIIKS